MTSRPTALIAEDEPLLREALSGMLSRLWPELEIVAAARNGREAIRLFDAHRPAVCFLDVQMPGVNGVEVARHVGRRAHVVFVTAFHRYAVEAFAQGAVDYILKPVEAERLTETVARLRERLATATPAPELEALLRELAERMKPEGGTEPLRWIRAQSGATVRMISVDDVDFLRSDAKHTLVAWRDETGVAREALVRTSLKELLSRLDPGQFAQVHRSVVVRLRSIRLVKRTEAESAEIHLKHRADVLPVSRTYLHVFRQM